MSKDKKKNFSVYLSEMLVENLKKDSDKGLSQIINEKLAIIYDRKCRLERILSTYTSVRDIKGNVVACVKGSTNLKSLLIDDQEDDFYCGLTSVDNKFIYIHGHLYADFFTAQFITNEAAVEKIIEYNAYHLLNDKRFDLLVELLQNRVTMED